MSGPDEPALIGLWERVLGDLLDRTGRFPKSARFSFASRIDGHALDVFEDLLAARYARADDKRAMLARADSRLAVLRGLIRVAHDRRLIDTPGLAHVSVGLDEAGRMLGGWRKQLDGRA